MEAGTLTTALVVEAAALVPTFTPPLPAVFATVTQPVAKRKVARRSPRERASRNFTGLFVTLNSYKFLLIGEI